MPTEENSLLTPICPRGWAENRGSFQAAFFTFHAETVILYHTGLLKDFLKLQGSGLCPSLFLQV